MLVLATTVTQMLEEVDEKTEEVLAAATLVKIVEIILQLPNYCLRGIKRWVLVLVHYQRRFKLSHTTQEITQ